MATVYIMDLLESREFKKFRNIIFILGIIAIVLNSLMFKYNKNKFMKTYLDSQKKIVGALVNEFPDMEESIVNVIFDSEKVSKEIILKGENLLNSYGYSESLNTDFLVKINKIGLIGNLTLSVLGVGFICVILSVFYLYHRKIMNKIALIEDWTKNLSKGVNKFNLKNIEDGEISKLFMSFNRINTIISENLENTKKEKRFLVDLLSDISHQLKTPLSAMILNTDMLIKKDFERKKALKLLESNEKQLTRMQGLIENLLKLAKFDSGSIVFKNEEKSLKHTLVKSIHSLNELATKHNVSVILDYSDDHSYLRKHDSFWIQEAFSNVIKNCIEHSKDNSVVKVSIIEENVFIKVLIEDEGEGISKEDIENIFKRFFKSNKSKKKNSVGIGLNLTKTILEGQDADIKVESELSIGTKFELIFLR